MHVKKQIKKLGLIFVKFQQFQLDYKYSKDKPVAEDIYVKISNDIIDKEVSKYIQYEKKLLSYNDIIIDINKIQINNCFFYFIFNKIFIAFIFSTTIDKNLFALVSP